MQAPALQEPRRSAICCRMSVKTEIWVKGHLRRCFAAGLTGVVARRGAAEAGSVFVKVTLAAGTARLLAPAAGPAYDKEGGRRWEFPLGSEPLKLDDIDRFLDRQIAFDPDIWVLDIDDPGGTGLLDMPEAQAETTGDGLFGPLGRR
jgi:hypothetical protein